LFPHNVDRLNRINTAGGAPVEIVDVSRGIWGGTVGVDRMLKLLNKYDIKATFFVQDEEQNDLLSLGKSHAP
jgi:hypothetical protein